MDSISITECKRLTQLEKIIKSGQQTFVEVGEALTEIRDKKLYRSDHKTFTEYCEQVWGWSASRARQLSIASETAKALPMVTNERAARALSKVPPPKRKGIVAAIVQSGQKVTAQAVAKLAPKLPPKHPTKPATGFLDATGIAVPPECQPLWNRLDEVKKLLWKITEIKVALRDAQSSNDKLFVEIDFTNDLAILSQLDLDLERAKPYAVCPTCGGIEFSNCLTCSGRGFVSKWYWEKFVPQETKDITGRK
jgi:hypothetical protein